MSRTRKPKGWQQKSEEDRLAEIQAQRAALPAKVVERVAAQRLLSIPGNVDLGLTPELGRQIQLTDIDLNTRLRLIESGKHKGNTKDLREYKMFIPQQLTDFQTDWCVGLVLGDATLQLNENAQNCRLKMQQSEYNQSLLFATKLILGPYVLGGIGDVKTREIGNRFRELDTMQHSAFMPIACLFQDTNIPFAGRACIQKQIRGDIYDWLTPVTIGSWFACDGGKMNYHPNGPKGIQLHTQGFTENCVDVLEVCLRDRYGWEIQSRYDGESSKGESQFLLELGPSSYENFVSIVKPYILEHFQKRLP